MDSNFANDRIGENLRPHLKEFIFDELSDAYLEKAGIKDILNGVPVPIRAADGGSISVLKIALNMAFVIGCDPTFEYRENYIKYILYYFDKRFADGLISDGLDGADKRDYDYACIRFRAAFLIDPDNAKAYYCYGRALKDAYELAEDEDFIGRFKAESMEAFEVATIKDPKLADAYYFLGYAYINMGLYRKAKLTWQTYLELVENMDMSEFEEDKKKEAEETIKEIRGRVLDLKDPVIIEDGYNLILSGNFEEGIEILKPYTESPYNKWWPLYYYLGTAFDELGKISEKESGMVQGDDATLAAYEEAVKYYLEVLKLSPSNEETMQRLAEIYAKLGETEKKEKYENKLKIVRQNVELDRQERAKEKLN